MHLISRAMFVSSWVTVLTIWGDGIRFNEIQVIGTHNSYHLAPQPAMQRLIDQWNPGAAASIDYTHRPLWEQFALLGIRQIELDVFADPDGGHDAKPSGLDHLKASQQELGDPHDPEGKRLQPGLKVLHVTDFDYRTTVYTFIDALREIRQWSLANPHHVPITVLVEVKQGANRPQMAKPIPFDDTQLREIDREIRSVLSDDHLILPDHIRGGRGEPERRDSQKRLARVGLRPGQSAVCLGQWGNGS